MNSITLQSPVAKMKFVYVVPLLICASLAYKLADVQPELSANIALKEAVVHQLKDLIEKLPSVLHSKPSVLQDTKTALLNDYIDAVLPGINQAILEAGYDPTFVPDEKINIGIGSSTLTEGNLTKLSTIERYENVTLIYDEEAKKVDIYFILRWEDLQLIYKYHTKVLLISMTGHVHANVEHLKIHLKLGFDFNANNITVDALDFNHTGDIKLTFSGNKVLDYITDAMSGVFTTIFHNLILSNVKKVAMDPVEDIVNYLNEIIDKTLNPNN